MIYTDTHERTSKYYEGKYVVASMNHNTGEFELSELGISAEREIEIQKEMLAHFESIDFDYSPREHGLYGYGY